MPSVAQLTTLGATLEGLWVNAANQCTSQAKLKWFKASQLGLNGEYVGDPVWITTVSQTGIAGPNSTVNHPLQSAFCMSLYSGSNLGVANHGRVYLPAPAYAVQADGFISGSQQNHVNWFGSWLKAIETSAAGWGSGGTTMKVRIMSKKGVTKNVAQLQGGNLIDTQRRRRNQLTETKLGGVGWP
jgi:hypothetical protein